MGDFLDEAVGDSIGGATVDLIGNMLHWTAWASGAAAVTLLSLGRFQIEPWSEEEEWLPAESGPVLRTFGATFFGAGLWAIAIAALVRAYFF
jgi:hypothetical protein